MYQNIQQLFNFFFNNLVYKLQIFNRKKETTIKISVNKVTKIKYNY